MKQAGLSRSENEDMKKSDMNGNTNASVCQ